MDQFFIDNASKSLKISGGTPVQLILEMILDVQAARERFVTNYNGYLIIARNLSHQHNGDGDLHLLSEFLIANILLQSHNNVTRLFSDSDLARIEAKYGKEIIGNFQALLRVYELRKRFGANFFPRTICTFSDIEESLQNFVIGMETSGQIFFGEDTVFVTMGSCFAENISKILSAAGYATINFASAEEASPATFEKFVGDLARDHLSDPSFQLITSARNVCLIYTAGIGEMLGLSDGSEIAAAELKAHPVRMRSIERVRLVSEDEIVAGLNAGFQRFKERLNPNAKLICTVSPVPLEASFSRERRIIPASNLSKIALLLGVTKFCSSHPEIDYYPSFEIVKDWAPLAGIQPFGFDDGEPRHVSRNLVLIICLMFIRKYLGHDAYKSALEKFGIKNVDTLRAANIVL
jgi:hypothetical protein